MTEKDAKTKWCPFAWGGRRVEDGDKSRCIGSECMAWVPLRESRGSSNIVGGRCGLVGS